MQRNTATVRPWSSVTVASHNCVDLPLWTATARQRRTPSLAAPRKFVFSSTVVNPSAPAGSAAMQPYPHSVSPPPLRRGQHITADCRGSEAGWRALRQSVPSNQIGKWVSGAFLKPIRGARGGVEAGAGGTSAASSPLLAGAGLGVIALGGGVGIAAFRRRAQGLS